MRRFGVALGVFAILGAGVLFCGALYLKSRVLRSPYDLQSRLRNQGIELDFGEPEFNLGARALVMQNVSLSSKNSPWRADAKTCTATARNLFTPVLELVCPALQISNSVKTLIPADLKLVVDNVKTSLEADYNLSLQTPPGPTPSAHVVLFAKGHFTDQRPIRSEGTLEVGNLELVLGNALDRTYEGLRSLPILKDRIGEAPKTVHLETFKAAFVVDNRTIKASQLLAKTDRLELTSDGLEFDQDTIAGKAQLRPGEEMVPAIVSEVLRAGEPRFGIPIVVSGPVKQPNVAIEEGWIANRMAAVLQRGVSQETQKFLKNEFETKWKGKLQEFFKNRLKR